MTTRISKAQYRQMLREAGKATSPRRDLEHQEQCAFVEWARTNWGRYPALELLHATPNGGYRARTTAIYLKAEGVEKGVPDMSLPVARGGFIGLAIEFKAPNRPATVASLTKDQKRWRKLLVAEGHQYVIVNDWQVARDIVIEYLEGE